MSKKKWMKCFFIQKTSPSLGTFSCEQANVVWVSCEFQKYVTTLWKRCASLNILQLLSPPRRPLWFSFTFLLEYPAEANLQRREVQLCLCRDTKLNTHTLTLELMECFHMTSRRPYWCPKTMKRRPCWCPKPILWELNSFLMQTLSFVPINLHRCWPREWKHSIA